MGNICGKSDSDAFSQPGRVLGSAPPQPQRASVPSGVSGPKLVGGPARTLGTTRPAAGGGQGQGEAEEEARRRAAEAAEVRIL